MVAQFSWYLVVGGLAFFVDIGVFVALSRLGVTLIPASIAGFVLATIANYFLSYFLAFQRGRFGRTHELARLFLVAGVGLVLNTAIVWLLAELLDVPPVIAKVVAVPIVLVWNFLGRRLFVFHRDGQAGGQALFERWRDRARAP
jgi:putative flippase GtrA